MVTLQQNEDQIEKLDHVPFLIPLDLLFPADLSSCAGFPIISTNQVVNGKLYISKVSKLPQSS